MIIHQEDMKVERKKNMFEGEGTVIITHFEAKSMKHARLFAEAILPPGASIGEHPHNSETEYYIILEGNGIVIDNGVKKAVKAGDLVVTGNGATHGIKNTGSVPLKLNAIIITD